MTLPCLCYHHHCHHHHSSLSELNKQTCPVHSQLNLNQQTSLYKSSSSYDIFKRNYNSPNINSNNSTCYSLEDVNNFKTMSPPSLFDNKQNINRESFTGIQYDPKVNDAYIKQLEQEQQMKYSLNENKGNNEYKNIVNELFKLHQVIDNVSGIGNSKDLDYYLTHKPELSQAIQDDIKWINSLVGLKDSRMGKYEPQNNNDVNGNMFKNENNPIYHNKDLTVTMHPNNNEGNINNNIGFNSTNPSYFQNSTLNGNNSGSNGFGASDGSQMKINGQLYDNLMNNSKGFNEIGNSSLYNTSQMKFNSFNNSSDGFYRGNNPLHKTNDNYQTFNSHNRFDVDNMENTSNNNEDFTLRQTNYNNSNSRLNNNPNSNAEMIYRTPAFYEPKQMENKFNNTNVFSNSNIPQSKFNNQFNYNTKESNEVLLNKNTSNNNKNNFEKTKLDDTFGNNDLNQFNPSSLNNQIDLHLKYPLNKLNNPGESLYQQHLLKQSNNNIPINPRKDINEDNGNMENNNNQHYIQNNFSNTNNQTFDLFKSKPPVPNNNNPMINQKLLYKEEYIQNDNSPDTIAINLKQKPPKKSNVPSIENDNIYPYMNDNISKHKSKNESFDNNKYSLQKIEPNYIKNTYNTKPRHKSKVDRHHANNSFSGNCFACEVGCNISNTGYSSMTFSPYNPNHRRRSVTPLRNKYKNNF